MAKSMPEDTFGNTRGSKFQQKALERARKKRMAELNEQNGELREQNAQLIAEKMDLEDVVGQLLDAKKGLEEDLAIAHGKILEFEKKGKKSVRKTVKKDGEQDS